MIKRKLKAKWKIILFITFFLILFFVYSFFIATMGFVRKEYKIINKDLPSSFYGLKIVHFSDLYYGSSINEKELIKIVSELNLAKPDIIIFSGDLIDKDTTYTQDMESILIKYLSKIDSIYGKYYVSGDNDKYKNSYYSLMEKSDFTSLDNDCEDITSKSNDSITICGLDTNSKDTTFLNKDLKNNNNYKLMIMHYPDYYNKIKDYNFNLILAGHSYNGQFRLPFINGIISKKNAKDYMNEYYKINDSDFYISSGFGTDNINMRFIDKPSFNLYRLVDK